MNDDPRDASPDDPPASTPRERSPNDAPTPDDAARRTRRLAHTGQGKLAPRAVGDWRSIRAFTLPQRRAIVALLALFLVCISVGLLRNRSFIDDPLPPTAARFDELADRLDPNTADVASLSALPQLGERRAADIVAFRERLRAGDPDRIVFKSIDDLMRVRGIGYALSRQAEPYLTFPATHPEPLRCRRGMASGAPKVIATPCHAEERNDEPTPPPADTVGSFGSGDPSSLRSSG